MAPLMSQGFRTDWNKGYETLQSFLLDSALLAMSVFPQASFFLVVRTASY